MNSIFTKPFLFLRQHNAGVEDIAAMQAAGFQAVFCNIGDPASPPEAWSVIRDRAQNLGVVCGPWLRVQAPDGSFSEVRLQQLIDVAHLWGSPYIVNAETELQGTGNVATSRIASLVGDDDAAVSTEAFPYADVHWYELGDIPILLQLFIDGGVTSIYTPMPSGRTLLEEWWAYGVKCVYPTFGSYGGRKPSDYILQAPYSIYTADDCQQNYPAWSPTSTGYIGCAPIPEPGGIMAGVKTEIDKAWTAFEAASVPDKWRNDNKGEYNKIKTYYQTPNALAPLGITSEFGKGLLALVEAGKYGDGTHA